MRKFLLQKTIYIIALAFLFCKSANACSINADSIVCLGNSIQFSADSLSGSVSSYSWNFGNSSTSTLATPIYVYPAAGKYTVTLIVNYGSSSCTTTKQVNVLHLPKCNFTLDSTKCSFCFFHNQICLKDYSAPGLSGNALAKRIALWGDGAASTATSFPAANPCHTYNVTGTFMVDMEVTDVKGCTKKCGLSPGNGSITILPDLTAKYKVDTVAYGCDSTVLCFNDISNYNSGATTPWWYLNGVKIYNGKKYCHSWYNNSHDKIKLEAAQTNGCIDSFVDSAFISITKYNFIIVDSPQFQCYSGNEFRFKKPTFAGMKGYVWIWTDSAGISNPRIPDDSDAVYDYFRNTDIGKWLVAIKIRVNDCIKRFGPVLVEVCGPRADFKVKNGIQCIGNDKPVIFCDESYYGCATHIKRLWDMGDKYCPQCTTDTKNNINVGKNCRYSKDINPKHTYDTLFCYSVKLALIDSVLGCTDTVKKTVSIGPPNAKNFTFKLSTPCMDKAILFDPNPDCLFSTYYINFDSACGINNFTPKKNIHIDVPTGLPYNVYKNTCDSDHWVTLGFIGVTGIIDSFYPRCDSNGIPYTKLCYDTFWIHHAYKLHVYNAAFHSSTGLKLLCPSDDITFYPEDSVQDSASFSYWQVYPFIDTQTNYIKPPKWYIPPFHVGHLPPGKYPILHRVIDTISNCEDLKYYYFDVGHHANFLADTIQCHNMPVHFYDSVFYFQQINYTGPSPAPTDSSYWHIRRNVEKLFWNFGDGTTDTGSNPVHFYSNDGQYTVTLVSLDSIGCLDTFVRKNYIRIVSPNADFYKLKDKFLCGEFVSLIDSSWFGIDTVKNLNQGFNKIVFHKWIWGDGKTPSYLPDTVYHNYTTFGYFSVTLIVKDTLGCIDSVTKQVYVKGPTVSFDFDGDSIGCVPFTVKLKNTSVDSTVSHYIWYFGDKNQTTFSSDNDSEVSFTYTDPGIYYIYLIGNDSVYNPTTHNRYFCTSYFPDTSSASARWMRVVVEPIPKARFTAPDVVCPKTFFNIIEESDTIYKSFYFNFGNNDSGIFTKKTITYKYDSSGVYTIYDKPHWIPPQYFKECRDSFSKPIRVSFIKAMFDTIPPSVPGDLSYKFINQSKASVRYYWDFDDPSTGNNNHSTEENPSHTFSDSNIHHVCLIAWNSENCPDTTCKDVQSGTARKLIVANVFTPDGDGINDVFDILIDGEEFYDLYIYNRWGELVFQQSEDGEGNNGGINWNGRIHNTGFKCSTGTYFYLFYYKFIGIPQPEYPLKGDITLLRRQ